MVMMMSLRNSMEGECLHFQELKGTALVWAGSLLTVRGSKNGHERHQQELSQNLEFVLPDWHTDSIGSIGITRIFVYFHTIHLHRYVRTSS